MQLWPNFSAPKAVITQMAEYENGGKVRVARSEHDTPSLSRRSSHTITFGPRNAPVKTCQHRPPHSQKKKKSINLGDRYLYIYIEPEAMPNKRYKQPPNERGPVTR